MANNTLDERAAVRAAFDSLGGGRGGGRRTPWGSVLRPQRRLRLRRRVVGVRRGPPCIAARRRAAGERR